ncbi:hypothetical protein KM043_010211 [Ampulex compressa]|nr:hypothetical protein KM043_010211 [Ampulex compressa]
MSIPELCPRVYSNLFRRHIDVEGAATIGQDGASLSQRRNCRPRLVETRMRAPGWRPGRHFLRRDVVPSPFIVRVLWPVRAVNELGLAGIKIHEQLDRVAGSGTKVDSLGGHHRAAALGDILIPPQRRMFERFLARRGTRRFFALLHQNPNARGEKVTGYAGRSLYRFEAGAEKSRETRRVASGAARLMAPIMRSAVEKMAGLLRPMDNQFDGTPDAGSKPGRPRSVVKVHVDAFFRSKMSNQKRLETFPAGKLISPQASSVGLIFRL